MAAVAINVKLPSRRSLESVLQTLEPSLPMSDRRII